MHGALGSAAQQLPREPDAVRPEPDPRHHGLLARAREYGLGGGDTVSTFTDTTFAVVTGIAAGEDGYVYVSGQAIVLDTLESDPHIRIAHVRVPRLPLRAVQLRGHHAGRRQHAGLQLAPRHDVGRARRLGNRRCSIPPASTTRSGGHTLYITDRGNRR